ncbi:major facilitator superfamily domain-containing protein [Filobasidium floriforme]|uniref:major facilitator superfamily domain-containing protein n=1 Tax=Filobasidium floriforme TaxID=5210 RepID=UPI001E8EBB06|nr:major facilitator superfamily domain-containing protein [Filobasidium floriforme]KAH8079912.1 major facilitator superfamily domain-containing protein [Filobasidium floriforme]
MPGDMSDPTRSETSTVVMSTPPPEKGKSSDMSDHTLKARPWRRYITPWDRIVSHDYPGQGTEEDPYLIDWLPGDEPDPENPMTWKTSYKWVVTVTAAVATLAVAMASSTLSAATNSIRDSFPGYKVQAYVMVTSGFVLGFVVGPLLWAPSSELFGRRNLFIFTYILFTIFNGSVIASQNIWTLIVLRFFAGTAGSSPLTNAGSVNANQRGLGMAVFSAAPFLGPGIGPIIGGFLGETGGWRWVAALIAMFSGILTIVGFLITPETYAPVLLQRRAALLSKVTGRVYRYKGSPKKVQPKQLFKTALSKPWILLFREPIVFLLSLYLAIVYGTLYMLFGAFPIVFQQERGWSPGIGGLAFVGVLVGFAIAVLWTIFIENPRYTRKNDAEGWLPPEQRLVPALIGGLLLPYGLFAFAWTASPKSIHWIAPIICSMPFGMGMVLVFLSIFNYLIDSYLLYAASVLAANSVLRSLFGVAFPLFVSNMYANLGVNWASTLVAFLSLACAPMPYVFFKFGRTIRRKSPYSREADDMGQKLREQALKNHGEKKA